MNTWRTKNGYEIVKVLSGRSNVYLIIKDRFLVLIDTGKESDYRKLVKNIDSLGLSVNKIKHLILTHTHFDHCQSARSIKDNSSCEVVVSSYAENCIKAGYTKLPKGTTFFTRQISSIGQLIGKRKFGYQPFESDILIHEDYYLNATNNQIKIIETSGHSDDSISIVVDNEIAIVGDVMFGVFRNSVFPPFADNICTMIRSWEKLLDTNCNIFLPGHGNKITRELLKRNYTKYSRKHNFM